MICDLSDENIDDIKDIIDYTAISTEEVEDLIDDLICFFKEWELWNDVEITYRRQKYSVCKPSEENEGFRGMKDVKIEPYDYDYDWVTISSKNIFANILGCNCDFSVQTFKYIMEKDKEFRSGIKKETMKALFECFDVADYRDHQRGLHGSIMDPIDFDSYEEYMEYEMDEVDNLEKELYKEIVSSDEHDYRKSKTADMIVEEFIFIL